jgi:hypothetical protein
MAQDSVLPRSKLKVQMPPGGATPRSGVYEQVGPTLMPISDRAYREIWKNLSEPGFEHVTVGENGEIHLGRVRLIRLQSPGAGSPEIGTGGRGHRAVKFLRAPGAALTALQLMRRIFSRRIRTGGSGAGFGRFRVPPSQFPSRSNQSEFNPEFKERTPLECPHARGS